MAVETSLACLAQTIQRCAGRQVQIQNSWISIGPFIRRHVVPRRLVDQANSSEAMAAIRHARKLLAAIRSRLSQNVVLNALYAP